MSWFHSSENLALASLEGGLSLRSSHVLELGTGPAATFDLLACVEDVKFFGDGDSSFLGITGDHDDVHTSGAALSDTVLHFITRWVTNADIADKLAVRLKLNITRRISKFLLNIVGSEVLHAATILGDSHTKNSKAFAGLCSDLRQKLLLLIFVLELFGITTGLHEAIAAFDDALGSTLEKHPVLVRAALHNS